MSTHPTTNQPAATSTIEAGHHAHDSRHRHIRGKKSDDPFLTRSLTAEVGEQFRQPSSARTNGDAADDNSGSLLADLITTPLTMISFIFSLVWVDRQQRQWRLSQQHGPNTTAGWSQAWLGPEPYQASPIVAKENGQSASEKGHASTYSGWYTRKKKRAIARMEISDALEMRKRVLFALLVWSGLVIWATFYVLRSLYVWVLGT